MSARLAYKLGEAAEALGVSERTLRRWCRRGLLRVVEIGGVKRIRADELNRLLDDHQPGEADRVSAVVDDLARVLAG